MKNPGLGPGFSGFRQSDAGSSVQGARVGPAHRVTLGGFVAHAVGLEVTLHRLVQRTAHHHLQTFRCVGLDTPEGGRGDTRQISLAVTQQTHRLDRVDVVVVAASAQHRLQQDLGLEDVARTGDQLLRGQADTLAVVVHRVTDLDEQLLKRGLRQGSSGGQLVAELALFMEKRAAQDGDSVATIGQLQVPNGSINVVPGKCLFSMDMRAPTDPQRDALERDVLQALDDICERRGLVCKREATLRAPAAPSAPEWQKRWENALKDLGVPLFVMPSGAGHDAMKLHEVMPQAMLFVRGENSGISHNPLESTTTDDMQLCIDAFAHVLHHLA